MTKQVQRENYFYFNLFYCSGAAWWEELRRVRGEGSVVFRARQGPAPHHWYYLQLSGLPSQSANIMSSPLWWRWSDLMLMWPVSDCQWGQPWHNPPSPFIRRSVLADSCAMGPGWMWQNGTISLAETSCILNPDYTLPGWCFRTSFVVLSSACLSPLSPLHLLAAVPVNLSCNTSLPGVSQRQWTL